MDKSGGTLGGSGAVDCQNWPTQVLTKLSKTVFTLLVIEVPGLYNTFVVINKYSKEQSSCKRLLGSTPWPEAESLQISGNKERKGSSILAYVNIWNVRGTLILGLLGCHSTKCVFFNSLNLLLIPSRRHIKNSREQEVQRPRLYQARRSCHRPWKHGAVIAKSRTVWNKTIEEIKTTTVHTGSTVQPLEWYCIIA